MAKKASKKSSGRSKGGQAGVRPEVVSRLKDLTSDPTVRYLAAGLATAVLSRLATRIGDRYPEISSFIKDNLDVVDKIGGQKPFGSEAETRH